MSINNQMSSSEELTALLDGELSSEQASSLFYELAKNPELQTEMQQLLTIKNTYRNARVVPPEYLKSNILASTGLRSPYFIGAIIAGLSQFFASTYKFIIPTVASLALIGSLFFSGVFDSSKIRNSNIIANSVNIREQNNYNGAIGQIISFIDKNDKSNNNNIASNLYLDDYKQDISANYNQSDIAFNNGFEEITPIDKSFPIQNGIDYTLKNAQNKLGFKNSFNDKYLNFLDRLTFRIAGGNSLFGPNYDLSNSNPFLQEFNVGMMYNINSNLSFGIEGGRMNFSHEYDAMIEGNLNNVRQEANYRWVALAGQYTFDPILKLEGVRPFIRLSTGVSDIGTIMNSSLGIQYEMINNFSVFTSFQGSTIFYNQDNTNYNAYRTGINLGFTVDL